LTSSDTPGAMPHSAHVEGASSVRFAQRATPHFVA
jgi:hypothetical protein